MASHVLLSSMQHPQEQCHCCRMDEQGGNIPQINETSSTRMAQTTNGHMPNSMQDNHISNK